MHYLLFIFPLPRLPLNLSISSVNHPMSAEQFETFILKAQRNPTRTTFPTNLASTTLISCNFSALPFVSLKTRNSNSRISFIRTPNPNPPILSKPKHPISTFQKMGGLQICQSSFNTQNPENPAVENWAKLDSENGDGGDGGDWTTSAFLFVLWVGLIYYVFNLTLDQPWTATISY